MTKFGVLVALSTAACFLPSVANAATTVLTFEDIPEGTVAASQYNGLTITGGSVLTQDSILNPIFPPFSPTNVLYNYLDGQIIIDFTTDVDAIGGYITGNADITLSAYDGATLLGSVSTGGANYIGAGTPNLLLNLTFDNITQAVFSSPNGGNSFTLDNLTVGGTITNNAVPEPSTWAMMLFGFGAIGFGMRRRKVAAKVSYSFA